MVARFLLGAVPQAPTPNRSCDEHTSRMDRADTLLAAHPEGRATSRARVPRLSDSRRTPSGSAPRHVWPFTTHQHPLASQGQAPEEPRGTRRDTSDPALPKEHRAAMPWSSSTGQPVFDSQPRRTENRGCRHQNWQLCEHPAAGRSQPQSLRCTTRAPERVVPQGTLRRVRTIPKEDPNGGTRRPRCSSTERRVRSLRRGQGRRSWRRRFASRCWSTRHPTPEESSAQPSEPRRAARRRDVCRGLRRVPSRAPNRYARRRSQNRTHPLLPKEGHGEHEPHPIPKSTDEHPHGRRPKTTASRPRPSNRMAPQPQPIRPEGRSGGTV